MKPFTVCCLMYGEYPKLAERLLASLHRFDDTACFDLRIGLNNVCAETARIVEKYVAAMPHVLTMVGNPPYYKYPMMRRLFHERPITTPHIMWFDDDSWIKRTTARNWFSMIEQSLQTAWMVGSIWTWSHWNANQIAFCKSQPWYAGKPIPKAIKFCTGGWWACRAELVQRHGWPIPELEHRGGDVLLGALCHQQGYRMQHLTKGVAINANESGKCSTSPRRGFDQRPCGYSYVAKPAGHWWDGL